MQNYLERSALLLPSQCDFSGKMKIDSLFDICQDMASEHAELLGIGFSSLTPRHMFWLTAKTRMHIYRRPDMLEKLDLLTWPEKAERIRCNRDYRLCVGDEVIAEGKTQWAVLETDTGKLHMVDDVYPKELITREETVFEEPFARISEKFEGEPFATYTVGSNDIDLGGHMNNVAYIRAALSCFTTKEREAMDIADLEIHFKTSCYEGNVLSIYRRDTDSGMELKGALPDGKASFLIKITIRR